MQDKDRRARQLIKELTKDIRESNLEDVEVGIDQASAESDRTITAIFSWGYYGEDGLFHEMGEAQEIQISNEGWRSQLITTQPTSLTSGDTIEFTYDITFS